MFRGTSRIQSMLLERESTACPGNIHTQCRGTDNNWAEFDVAMLDDLPYSSNTFDASHLSEQDRYADFKARFVMRAPQGGLFNDQRVPCAPSDIDPWDNEYPPGTEGHTQYGRSADDPFFRLWDDDPLVRCFKADQDAIETHPGFGDGKMPRLANMMTMGMWDSETRQLGDGDARPTEFEP